MKLDPLIVQLHDVQKGPGDSLEESRERRPASRRERRADKTLRQTLNEQVLHPQV